MLHFWKKKRTSSEDLVGGDDSAPAAEPDLVTTTTIAMNDTTVEERRRRLFSFPRKAKKQSSTTNAAGGHGRRARRPPNKTGSEDNAMFSGPGASSGGGDSADHWSVSGGVDGGQNSDQESTAGSNGTAGAATSTIDDEELFGFRHLRAYGVLQSPSTGKAATQPSSPSRKDGRQVVRTITFKRRKVGDFDFSLHRVQLFERLPDGGEVERPLTFVESKGSGRHSQDNNGARSTTLLPGELLLRINGTSVENLTKDEIGRLLQCACDEVSLELCEAPELMNSCFLYAEQREPASTTAAVSAAYCDRGADTGQVSCYASDFWRRSARNSELMSSVLRRKSVDKGSNIWLAHIGGFCSATVIGAGDQDGTVRIRLDDTGKEMIVDESDVERRNPEHLNYCEDLRLLIFLNESSVSHVLRTRFSRCFPYTRATSRSVVAVTVGIVPVPLSKKVTEFYRCLPSQTMPVHLYSVAKEIVEKVVTTRRSCAIVFTGRSGSGKTTQLSELLRFMCSSPRSRVSLSRLEAAQFVLNSFGNCCTMLNANASRFAALYSVELDEKLAVSGIFVQTFLLEHMRVTRQNHGETNFFVFNYMWEGKDPDLRKETQLDLVQEPSTLLSSGDQILDSAVAKERWVQLLESFRILGVERNAVTVVLHALAAIFHLHQADSTKGLPSAKSTFAKPMHAQLAADLLGVDINDLQSAIFSSFQQRRADQQANGKDTPEKKLHGSATKEKISRVSCLERLAVTECPGDGTEALNSFICNLYRETFFLVTDLVNRAVSSGKPSSTACLQLVDYPGYQRPLASRQSKRTGASWAEFAFNYVNERFSGVYHESCFTDVLDTYKREGIDIQFDFPEASPFSAIDVIDLPPKRLRPNVSPSSKDKRGILWLLDDMAAFPGSTDQSFLERLFVHYGQHDALKKAKLYGHFTIRHALGTFPVTYNTSGWLKQVRDSGSARSVLPLLQNSKKDVIASLFSHLHQAYGVLTASSVASQSNGSVALKRSLSLMKVLSTQQPLKRRSSCSYLKVQTDVLVESVRRCTDWRFLHCFLHCKPTSTGFMPSAEEGSVADAPLLRQQLRSLHLVDAVRLEKIGYPEQMSYVELQQQYKCLQGPVDASMNGGDDGGLAMGGDRRMVTQLFAQLGVDSGQAKFGYSRVFMKCGVGALLQSKRDEFFSEFVTRLQAVCRGFLARQKLNKLRTQRAAILIIQRNGRKYMCFRSWPWWKLYTRLLPLLNVHQAEEKMKQQDEELVTLRESVKRLESSVAAVTAERDLLQAQVCAARAELNEERLDNGRLTQTFEEESTMRLRAEKELADLLERYSALEAHFKDQSADLVQLQQISMSRQSTANVPKPCVPGGAKEAADEMVEMMVYERIRDALKDKEAAFKEELAAKTELEAKLKEALEENSSLQQKAVTFKNRADKACQELEDMRASIQQMDSTNASLAQEKISFNEKLAAVRRELVKQQEGTDALKREKDEALTRCYNLERELQLLRDDLLLNESKLKQRDRELGELTSAFDTGGDSAEQKLIICKRQKQNLEAKCADLEDELNEMADDLQQLKSKLTQSEMNVEKLKRENKRLTDEHYDEISKLNSSWKTKLQNLENQLEDEQHRSSQSLRKIRELESRVAEADEEAAVRENTKEESYKRAYRKTKALLRDAQQALEQCQKNAPSKSLVSQLKTQLEEAEANAFDEQKAKQKLEIEVRDLQDALSSLQISKSMTEERCLQLLKEKTDLESRVTDSEDKLQELVKKFKAQQQQCSVDVMSISDYLKQISDLEKAKDDLQEMVTMLTMKLERLESGTAEKSRVDVLVLEAKIRQLEVSLNFETTKRVRLENAYAKERSAAVSLREQIADGKSAEGRDREEYKRLKQQVSEMQETVITLKRKEASLQEQNRMLEQELERSQTESAANALSLKFAMRRIEDLQFALQEGLSASSDSDEDDDDEIDHLHNYAPSSPLM